MKLRYNIIIQEVGQSFLGVTVGEGALVFPDVLFFNEISAFIVKQLNEEKSYEDLLKALMDTYDADKDVLSCHLDAFIESLRQQGLL